MQPNHACNMAVLDKAPTSRSLYYTLRKSICVFYKVSALHGTLSIINTSFRYILTLRSLTSLTICRANECNQTLKLQGDYRTAKVWTISTASNQLIQQCFDSITPPSKRGDGVCAHRTRQHIPAVRFWDLQGNTHHQLFPEDNRRHLGQFTLGQTAPGSQRAQGGKWESPKPLLSGGQKESLVLQSVL